MGLLEVCIKRWMQDICVVFKVKWTATLQRAAACFAKKCMCTRSKEAGQRLTWPTLTHSFFFCST